MVLGEDKHLHYLWTLQEGKVWRLVLGLPGHFLGYSTAPVKQYLLFQAFFFFLFLEAFEAPGPSKAWGLLLISAKAESAGGRGVPRLAGALG